MMRISFAAFFGATLFAALTARGQETAGARPFLAGPIWVYNNWSSYDELSDNVPLTEAASMRELGNVLRLRRLGVRFDDYVMDAFWYDPDGGYRKWRLEGWPHGPDHWFDALAANGVVPGLWFGTNSLPHLNPAPQWRESLTTNQGAMALYHGPFLSDFSDVLQHWYDRGVRLFKFDFAMLDAAVAGDEARLAPAEILARNSDALRDALAAFRRKNPDVVLVAFNGFGGRLDTTVGPMPFKEPLDLRWLEVFDTLYAGDPRPSDVPEMNFWRSMDIYSDHMVGRFFANGVPLRRIDSTSFMVGDTGTNYHRKTDAWKGMLILEMARGGWINTIHGNLEFLSDADARWFARAQRLYMPLQQAGTTTMFGGIPGAGEPYGFASDRSDRALYAVVNPAQRVARLALPPREREPDPLGPGQILFSDAGFEPVLADNAVTLGPGQLALIGFGQYASNVYDLGVEEGIEIPRRIAPLRADFLPTKAKNTFEAVISPPREGDLRIVMQQYDLAGRIVRSVSPKSMSDVFVISATQSGRKLPVEIRYDHVVWSGMSWAVGEIRHAAFRPGSPIRVRLYSADDDRVRLDGHVYAVGY